MSRQCSVDLMARFTKIKSLNPNLRQSGLAKELEMPCSSLQRYRHHLKRQSPYKSNTPLKTQKTSNDLKRPQMTSKILLQILKRLGLTNSRKANLKTDKCTRLIMNI